MNKGDYVQLPNGQHGQINEIVLKFYYNIRVKIMSYGQYEIGEEVLVRARHLTKLKQTPNPILEGRTLIYQYKGCEVSHNIDNGYLHINGTEIGLARNSPYGPILYYVRPKMRGLI